MRILSQLSLFAVACGLAAAACVPMTAPLPDLGGAAPEACRITHVVDGDTVDLACPGEGRFRARLTGFDTPESYEPGCTEEARLARQASDRLRELVTGASEIGTDLGGYDRYGRRLVALRLDGVAVADTLIGEGLAVRYNGGRRINWCARLG